ncbi:MAG: D-alanyl-D-alanine carboxypeptidase family protein [Traorella sp.]
MKKICLLFLLFYVFIQPIKAQELATHAQSAYLMEYTTGQVLFEKNSEMKLYPASMTKMMSLILVYEALNQQSLHLNDMITVSENASSMGGSQIFLQVNEQMSVNDLLKAICIASANDAMVALAEHISGSVTEFVKKMNQKAKEYQLINTNFVNTTGLHDENHYSCAKDMAIIAQKLIQIGGEEMLSITSTYDAYVREDTKNPFWLVNTNKLVKFNEFVDGLKTGFTSEALSCITITAKKDNIRLIAVVMKEPDSKTRNTEVLEMIQVGFTQLDYQLFFEKESIFSDYHFEYGMPHDVQLMYLNDVFRIINKNKILEIKSFDFTLTQDKLPLEKGNKVGEVLISFDDESSIIVDVGVNQNVRKMEFWDYFMMTFWNVLT